VAPQIRWLSLNSEDLTWKDFEHLVAQLAQHPKGAHLQGAVFRGGLRQAPYGAHIVAHNPYRKRDHVFQCRHVPHVQRGDLKKWTNDFLEGDLCATADAFYLCLTADIDADTQLVQEWKECRELLADCQIRPELWHRRHMEDLLRAAPDLVSELFGQAIARDFCSQPAPELSFAKRYRPAHTRRHGRFLTLEQESTQCTVALPGEGQMSLSASISFARDDLHGVSVSVPAKTLLAWLRWRAHAEPTAARPYALPHEQSGRFVFRTETAAIMLNAHELAQLDWIFRQAWPAVLDATTQQEERWKTLRFARHTVAGGGGAEEPAYGLLAVHRQLWQATLQFAQEHDAAKGTSPWHIFDGSACGVLKVHTPTATDTLDAGMHLIIHPHHPACSAMPWEDEVVLAWHPIESTGQGAAAFSPRRRWNAEYAHDWLLHSLLPEVLQWDAERAEHSSQAFSPMRRMHRDSLETAKQNVSNWAHSLALDASREQLANDDAGAEGWQGRREELLCRQL
jgi:hypothetical protein